MSAYHSEAESTKGHPVSPRQCQSTTVRRCPPRVTLSACHSSAVSTKGHSVSLPQFGSVHQGSLCQPATVQQCPLRVTLSACHSSAVSTKVTLSARDSVRARSHRSTSSSHHTQKTLNPTLNTRFWLFVSLLYRAGGKWQLLSSLVHFMVVVLAVSSCRCRCFLTVFS